MKQSAYRESAPLRQPAPKYRQVYRVIRDAIVKNEFRPGTVLVERTLCDKCSVSRAPVRSALQQLALEGLVTYIPGRGMAVSTFSLKDILEVYDLLEAMQIYAVCQCISRMDAMTAAILERFLDCEGAALDAGDLYGASQWAQQFHGFLAERSGNRRLKIHFDQLNLQQMRFLTLTARDCRETALQARREIFRTIRERDAGAAEQAVRRHYAALRQYYITKFVNQSG